MRNVRMAIWVVVVCVMISGRLAGVSATTVYDFGGEHDIDFITMDRLSIEDNIDGTPTIVNLVADGIATSMVLVYDNSIFNVAGGRVDSFILAYNNSQVNVSSGSIWSSLIASHNTVLTISGGWIEIVELCDDSQALMTGGSISEGVDIFDNSVLTVEGTGFNYAYGAITDSTGILTGTFSNGDPIDLWFYMQNNASIVLIPEPTTLLLLGLGGLMLRRKR